MAADLARGELLTEYGLASEKLSSDNFRTVEMAKGFILPPTSSTSSPDCMTPGTKS
jgi:hypothetical protein